jgi:hypothetical protein
LQRFAVQMPTHPGKGSTATRWSQEPRLVRFWLLLSVGRFDARGTFTREVTCRTSARLVFAEGEFRPGLRDFFI